MPKNGNITGQVFDEAVIKQIEARQEFLGSRNKTDSQIIYANNSNAFLRLGSSINISDPEPLKLRSLDENYTGNKLAKACVLFGGTVGVDNSLSPLLKFGIYNRSEDPISTIAEYGWGGISSKGFVPMPLIESADVGFYNRGALAKASVKLKVFSVEQLQIFDLLYFRIGYTMLLEWGHNVWIDNNKNLQNRTEFVTEPFQKFFGNDQNISQQDIIRSIQNQRLKDFYNYDAMLGKVTNFTWKFNDDGSYDIELKLVGLGDIIESLKINTASASDKKALPTPSQLADKKQSNIDAGYKATDEADAEADKKKEDAEKKLQEKVDGVNKEIEALVKKYKTAAKALTVYTWVDSSAKSAINNYKQFAQNFSANVTADAGSNKQTHETINNEISNTYTAGSEIIDDEGQSDYEKYYKPKFDNLRNILVSIRNKVNKITPSDTKSIANAESEAERIKKENEAKRRGLDAASQKLERENEIRSLSPVTSVESKNKTKFNEQLYNWRQEAISGQGKGNLFKLTLTASSANSGKTGTSNLSLDFYYMRLGYLLEWIQNNLLVYDTTKKFTPKEKETFLTTGTPPADSNPIFTIDFDAETNFCLSFPSQVSADPKVCLIPSKFEYKLPPPTEQPTTTTPTVNPPKGKNKQKTTPPPPPPPTKIEWNLLPELKNYFVDGNAYAGKMMNIFINIDHTAGVLDRNLDANGKVNLLKFLSDLFNTINDALGNVNKIEPQFDTEENQLKFIEGSSIEGLEKLINDKLKEENKMAIFQSYGIGSPTNPNASFLTNVDFQVQLPPNMAAMATISAQAGGNIVGENATGLSKLNVGLTDRLISVKLDKDSIEGAETGKADPTAIFISNLQLASSQVKDIYINKKYAKESVDSLRSLNRDLALYLTGNDAINNQMPSPFFIPFNLSLNMKGLSGMRNYERFGITEQILPYSYRPYQSLTNEDGAGVIDFLIKGLSHKIDNNSWETKIESISVSSNRKWKANKS
jgi:hypothetical protein